MFPLLGHVRRSVCLDTDWLSANRLLPNCILKSRSRETIPLACKEERQLSFFRLISIKSDVLSKRLITCGKCKTPIRGRGRQFNRTDSISGKVYYIAEFFPCFSLYTIVERIELQNRRNRPQMQLSINFHKSI